MLVQALQAHNDPNGTAPKQLFQWMAATYPLQANFRPSASQALQKAFKRGRFEKNKEGKYRLNASWEGGNVSVLLLEGNRIIITFLFYSRQLEGRQGDHRATQKQSQILVPRLTLQQILRHTHHNAILGSMVARSFPDHPHIAHPLSRLHLPHISQHHYRILRQFLMTLEQHIIRKDCQRLTQKAPVTAGKLHKVFYKLSILLPVTRPLRVLMSKRT